MSIAEQPQTTPLERAQARRDEALARPITIRCADCLWETEGGVLEARREWAEHRRDEHDDASALASIERVAKPLTKREVQHGGRRHKFQPRCSVEGCTATAVHPSSGLCHEHHLKHLGDQRRARANGKENEVRTCEEVPGCTNPTVSDRGVYARVCSDHKELVTKRRREQGLGTGAQPDPNRHSAQEPAGRNGDTAPPVVAPPLLPELPDEPTLSDLARAVEEAAAAYRRHAEQLELAADAHCAAVEALRAALGAQGLPEAA